MAEVPLRQAKCDRTSSPCRLEIQTLRRSPPEARKNPISGTPFWITIVPRGHQRRRKLAQHPIAETGSVSRELHLKTPSVFFSAILPLPLIPSLLVAEVVVAFWSFVRFCNVTPLLG